MGIAEAIDEKAKDILFRTARTYNGWQAKDVPDALLQEVFGLLKFGPTSANCSPMRVKFVKSEDAKKRLLPLLAEGNVKKTQSAPVVALIAYDMKFYDHLPKLFPHTDARSWFSGNAALAEATAMRNGTLQAAYLMLAARSLGLDCGPMSGFDADAVKTEFFADEDVVVDLVCSLGYGDESTIFDRSPRFDFADVCQIV